MEKKWKKYEQQRNFNHYAKAYFFVHAFGNNNCTSICMIAISQNCMTMFLTPYTALPCNTHTQSSERS